MNDLADHHRQYIELADEIAVSCIRLGHELLQMREDGLTATRKPDNSLVSPADYHADEFLNEALAALTPDIPVISEESVQIKTTRAIWPRFWSVDPVDASANYLKMGDDFSINIALIDHEKPVLGLLFFPAKDFYYVGVPGVGAVKKFGDGRMQGIMTQRDEDAALRIVVSSKSHANLDKIHPIVNHQPVGEIHRIDGAIKFAYIAEGLADLYPRFTHLREWDLAAGHAIVEAAGGIVLTPAGDPINYGQAVDFACPFFAAANFDFSS